MYVRSVCRLFFCGFNIKYVPLINKGTREPPRVLAYSVDGGSYRIKLNQLKTEIIIYNYRAKLVKIECVLFFYLKKGLSSITYLIRIFSNYIGFLKWHKKIPRNHPGDCLF